MRLSDLFRLVLFWATQHRLCLATSNPLTHRKISLQVFHTKFYKLNCFKLCNTTQDIVFALLPKRVSKDVTTYSLKGVFTYSLQKFSSREHLILSTIHFFVKNYFALENFLYKYFTQNFINSIVLNFITQRKVVFLFYYTNVCLLSIFKNFLHKSYFI